MSPLVPQRCLMMKRGLGNSIWKSTKLTSEIKSNDQYRLLQQIAFSSLSNIVRVLISLAVRGSINLRSCPRKPKTGREDGRFNCCIFVSFRSECRAFGLDLIDRCPVSLLGRVYTIAFSSPRKTCHLNGHNLPIFPRHEILVEKLAC